MEKNLIIEFNGLSPNGYNQTLETFSPMRDEAIVDKLRDTKRQKCGKRVALIENNSIKKVWNSVSECAEDLNLNQSKIVSVCGGKRRTTGDKIFRYLDEKGTPIEVKYDPQPSLTRVTKSSRKVLQLDLVTKEVLNSFDSLQIAANHAKCDQSGIAKVCNGKRKSCGGYCWMYVDN